MLAEPTVRRRRGRRRLLLVLVALLGIAVVSEPSHPAAAHDYIAESPEPTDPPPEDETEPDETDVDEAEVDETETDTDAPEPASVPAGVWIAAILVLVVAIVWATRASSDDLTTEPDDS